MSRDTAHERRLRALDELIEQFEAEHGEISEAEMRAARRRAGARATIVRGRGSA